MPFFLPILPAVCLAFPACSLCGNNLPPSPARSSPFGEFTVFSLQPFIAAQLFSALALVAVVLPAGKDRMQDQEKDRDAGNSGNNDYKHFDIDENNIVRPAGNGLIIAVKFISMGIPG